MKIHSTLQRILHIVLILSFVLPFMTVQCTGPSSKEITEKNTADSVISEAHRVADSVTMNIDTTTSSSAVATINSDTLNRSEKNSSLSDIILGKDDNYTGIGILYLDITTLRAYVGIFIAFLLILISTFTLTQKRYIGVKRIIIYDFVAFLFLSASINKDILWGFWVCYGLLALTILLDFRAYIGLTRSEMGTHHEAL